MSKNVEFMVLEDDPQVSAYVGQSAKSVRIAISVGGAEAVWWCFAGAEGPPDLHGLADRVMAALRDATRGDAAA